MSGTDVDVDDLTAVKARRFDEIVDIARTRHTECAVGQAVRQYLEDLGLSQG